MIFGWLRRRRRRRHLARPVPDAWRAWMEQMDFVEELSAEHRTRLDDLVRVFVHEVHWEGRAGLEVTDEMRVVVAAQACRLILALPDDAYRKVRTIYLFPSTYAVSGQSTGKGGTRSGALSHRLGEAHLRGPVVLSWDAARHGVSNPDDGRNVVYHEFAHKLDMLDAYADGTPPVDDRRAYDAWTRIAGEEYAALVEAKARGRKTLLDKYGATNPAEFFAVATEMFFERPRRLRERHEELYGCLVAFYDQDPARPG